MQKTQFKGVALLLLTALIWGIAFVAQSAGMENVGAFTFSGVRTWMAVCVLLPFILIRDRLTARYKTKEQLAERKAENRRVLKYGVILGVVFCAAGNLQQFAFYDSTSGKIAFITALYMFFVPLIGALGGKRIPALTWLSVAAGFVGLYFLCIDPNNLGAVNRGDLLALGCSVLFAVHILLIERFACRVDGVKLSCAQFAVSAAISTVCMFLFEHPTLAAIRAAIVPLLYAGLMSSGLAYTFQIIGQKYTDSTVASLLMCMESVFGVLAGAVLLHERLSGREIFGCAVMFAAILLSQVSGILTDKLRARRK